MPRKKDIIDAIRRSKKVRKEDFLDWLRRKYKVDLPKSASWDEIYEVVSRKVSVSALESWAKKKGIKL